MERLALQEAVSVLSDPERDARLEGTSEDAGFLWRLVNLDPALWRGVIVSGVLLLGSFGLVIADNKRDSIIGFIAVAVSLIQALWTRPAVTANRKVVAYKPNPVDEPHVVCPGGAVSTDVVAVSNAAAQTPDMSRSPYALPFPPEVQQ